MRAHLQRVQWAKVSIDGAVHAQIEQGLLILLGVGPEDDLSDVEYLSKKISGLRIFADDAGKMNLSVCDIAGSALVISQFTLFANCKKGTRPSFVDAAKPERARNLYRQFAERLQLTVPDVKTGVFAADMAVELLNDGPVTILLDSRAR